MQTNNVLIGIIFAGLQKNRSRGEKNVSVQKTIEEMSKKEYSAFQTASFIQRDGTNEEINVALPGTYNVIEAKIETDENQK